METESKNTNENQKQNTGLIVPSEYMIADEVVKRLGEMHLQTIYKQTSRIKNVRNFKIEDLVRKAGVMTKLTISSAVLLSKNLQDIKKYPDAKELIYKATGLMELKIWLDKQGKHAEKILSTSGKADVVESLLQLKVTTEENEKMFAHLNKFRTRVSELLKWLQVVATLNQQSKTNPKIAKLAALIGLFEKAWNQNRMYLILVISTIIEKDKVDFQINDIKALIQRLRMPGWKKNLIDALRSIPIDGTTETLADDPTVLEIIRSLENPKNHTPFYFLKKVPFEKEAERKLLEDSRSLMQDAMYIVVTQNRTDPERKETGDSPDFREKVTHILAAKNILIAYSYLLRNPYIIPWIEEEEVFRLSWFSKDDPTFIQTVGPYDTESRIAAAYEKLNSSVMIKTVVQEILTSNTVFGIPYEFFQKNRSLNRNEKDEEDTDEKPEPKSFTESVEQHMTRGILRLAIGSFNSWYFSRWLKEMETKKELPEVNNLSKRRLLAAYFSTDDAERPAILKKVVEGYNWMAYIDEDSINHFREMATKRSQKKVTVKDETPAE